jgi:hypothetical protein
MSDLAEPASHEAVKHGVGVWMIGWDGYARSLRVRTEDPAGCLLRRGDGWPRDRWEATDVSAETP